MLPRPPIMSESSSNYDASDVDEDEDRGSRHSDEQYVSDSSHKPLPSRVDSNSPPRAAFIITKKLLSSYLELLNATTTELREQSTTIDHRPLDASLIGGSYWTSAEKERFFFSLHRYGTHDIESIATIVKSKTVLEIRQYILALQDGLEVLQTKARGPESPHLLDHYAAHDLSEEIVAILDDSSDALEALSHFQLCEMEKMIYGDRWIIDEAHVEALDSQLPDVREQEIPSDSSEARPCQELLSSDNDQSSSKNHMPEPDKQEESNGSDHLFRSSVFIRLMQSVFMNCNSDENSGSDGSKISTPGSDGPSILRSAFENFYNIVLGLTRRLVQAAIMQANMRLRADRDVRTIPTVRALDVLTALDVLNMQQQSRQEYWRKVMKRYDIRVFSQSMRFSNGRQRKSKRGFQLTATALDHELKRAVPQAELHIETRSNSEVESDMSNHSQAAGGSHEDEYPGEHSSLSSDHDDEMDNDERWDMQDLHASKHDEKSLRQLFDLPWTEVPKKPSHKPHVLRPEVERTGPQSHFEKYTAEWELPSNSRHSFGKAIQPARFEHQGKRRKLSHSSPSTSRSEATYSQADIRDADADIPRAMH